MSREQEMMLKQIMELDFAVVELNLYMNTHPNDKRILAIFKNYAAKAKAMKEEYSRKFTPVTAAENMADTWEWNKSPWPWEKM